jgi:hypothetical protein
MCPNYVAPQRTLAAAGLAPTSYLYWILAMFQTEAISDLLATRSVDARGWLRKQLTSVVNYGTGIHQNIVFPVSLPCVSFKDFVM